MNLDRPIVAAAAQIAPVFMKKKESIEKYAEVSSPRTSSTAWDTKAAGMRCRFA